MLSSPSNVSSKEDPGRQRKCTERKSNADSGGALEADTKGQSFLQCYLAALKQFDAKKPCIPGSKKRKLRDPVARILCSDTYRELHETAMGCPEVVLSSDVLGYREHVLGANHRGASNGTGQLRGLRSSAFHSIATEMLQSEPEPTRLDKASAGDPGIDSNPAGYCAASNPCKLCGVSSDAFFDGFCRECSDYQKFAKRFGYRLLDVRQALQAGVLWSNSTLSPDAFHAIMRAFMSGDSELSGKGKLQAGARAERMDKRNRSRSHEEAA